MGRSVVEGSVPAPRRKVILLLAALILIILSAATSGPISLAFLILSGICMITAIIFFVQTYGVNS